VTNLLFASNPVLLTVVLIAAMLVAMEITYRGAQHLKVIGVDDKSWDTIRNGIITLVAFMLGLTYAQAQGRFDARRELVVKEANAIGTTWLRADQLAPKETAEFRLILTAYTRDRLEAYSTPGQPSLYVRVMDDSDRRQAQLWSLASAAVRHSPTDQGKALLMSTLNDTIDVSSEQVAALTHHVPTAVLVLTFVLVLLGAVTIGLQFARAKSRPIGLTLLYAASFAIVLNLIVDFDRPQVGFVHVSLDPIRIQLHGMEH
jgi:hypothetical protein